MKILIGYAPWILVLSLLSACQKNQERASADEPVVLQGSLELNATQQIAGRWADDCDKKVTRDWKLELTRALDSKSKEIEKYAEENNDSSLEHHEPLGPTYMTSPKENVSPEPGWTASENSWAGTWTLYKKIQNQTMNRSWLKLNANVRSLLMDDKARALMGRNYLLDRNSGPILSSIFEKVHSCLQDSGCKDISFSETEKQFTQNQPFYNFWIRRMNSTLEFTTKKSSMAKLLKEIERDQKQYSFVVNPKIRRMGQKLILPLGIGDFAGAEAKMANLIETIWKSDALSVQIEWVPHALDNLLYKILLNLGYGERGFVNRAEATVNLPVGVGSKTIPHEIGHVLGFRDHYYTVWQPNVCVYQMQINNSDIMSSSKVGLPTAEEFQELNNAYQVSDH